MSAITDTTSHITAIQIAQSTQTLAINSIQVFAAGQPLQKVPSNNCTESQTVKTITLSSTQRIARVDAWSIDSVQGWGNYLLYEVKFTFNDGTTDSFTGTTSSPNNYTNYNFITPFGQEFVGLEMGGPQNQCITDRLAAYYRPINCLDPANIIINFATMTVFQSYINLDQNIEQSFGVTDLTYQGCGPVELLLTYSPASTTNNLIQLNSNSPPAKITFLASQDDADANNYAVTVQARFSGQTTWITSKKTNFYYISSECNLNSITSYPFDPPTISTTVMKLVQTTANIWVDAVSGSTTSPKCGPMLWKTQFDSYPTNFVATMGNTDFVIFKNSTNVGFQVSPLYQPEEVGQYSVSVIGCLKFFPTVCAKETLTVDITDCVITKVQVTSWSYNYVYWYTAVFSQTLTVIQTPSCGYSVTDWIVSQGAQPTGNCNTNFYNVVPNTGYYSITPGSNSDCSGTYTGTISRVSVNQVPYDASSGALFVQGQFSIIVSDGCSWTTVTAKSVSDIQINMWDTVSIYPQSGAAFSDFTDSMSLQKNDADLCPKTYQATIAPANTLTAFSMDQATKQFTINSDNYNQVGTYIVTLTGSVTAYPSRTANTQFKIVVIDPCLTTTLIMPNQVLTAMQTSVLLSSNPVTQQVELVNDTVSFAHGNGTDICGARKYSISSVKISASQPLNSTELSINPLTGVISVDPLRQATVGTHQVTVVVNLFSYPNISITLASFVLTIDPCVVTSVKVVKNSNGQFLVTQNYTLSSSWTGNLTYHLKVKTTPSCGYSGSDWQVSASGPVPANFQNISASTGIYTVGPTTDTSQTGAYTIQITNVKVNVITYDQTQLLTPSSFTLNVLNPCNQTTVAATAVSTIYLKVWDAESNYPSTGTAFDDFTDTVSTANNVANMCEKTYSATVQPKGNGVSLTKFQFDSVSNQFKISSQSYDQIGTYTVTLRGEITDFPTLFATKDFIIEVLDPCQQTSLIQVSPALQQMTTSVLVSSGAVTQFVGPVKDLVSQNYDNGSDVCGAREYSISSVKNTASRDLNSTELTIDPSSGLISVATSDSATIGTHTATVVAKLTRYQNITISLTSFTITIQACIVTSIQVVQQADMGNLAQQFYTLSSSVVFSYNLTTKQTPSCGYSSYGWQVSSNGTPAADFQKIDSTGNYTYGPTTNSAKKGLYTVQVTSVTVNGKLYVQSQVVAPSNFVFQILSSCDTTTVYSSTVTPITLSVWDQEDYFPLNTPGFAEFTDSIANQNGVPNMCAKTYTATVSSNTAGINLTKFSIDSQKRQFLISSQSYDQIGTYTVTLTGTVTQFPSQSISTTFTITVLDPCLKTTLIPPTTALLAMTTSILVQQADGSPYYETQNVGIFNDTMSFYHGDATVSQYGTQYCGVRVYHISSQFASPATNNLSPTELEINLSNGTISVYTTNTATIGTHQVTVEVKLTNYPSVIPSTLVAFQLEIQPCIVTNFSMSALSPVQDQQYTISDSILSWSIYVSSIQIPACGYSQTLNQTNAPTFVTTSPTIGTSLGFQTYSRNNLINDTYVITLTSTLNNYNFSPAKQPPQCESTFQLKVENPCHNTVIKTIPLVVENLIAFAGQNITGSLNYTFNDTESEKRTLTSDDIDYCEEKVLKFKLNDTNCNFLSATNTGQINLNPPFSTKTFGEAKAQVFAIMKVYPTIMSVPVEFNVTILGFAVPVIKTQYYQVGQDILKIDFEPFRVLPETYNIGSSSLSVYILSPGATLGNYVDFNCNCMTLAQDIGFISLSTTSDYLNVYTTDNALVGEHSIVVVQTFESFPTVHPYSKFLLSIKPVIVIPIAPPQFQPALPTNIQENQCSTPQTKPWSFQLPPVFDPSNSAVRLTVKLDESYFTFDSDSKTISQMKLAEASVNKTIKITLKNELGKAAQFQMNVQFICEIKAVEVANFTPKQQITQSKTVVKKAAWISIISRTGLVDVQFYSPVFVPQFYNSNNLTTANETRKLSQTAQLKLEDYINEEVLQVQVKTKLTVSNVSWVCTNFTDKSLQIQLNFTDPSAVSQGNQDQLVLSFTQTDRFVLSSKQEYLFSNQSIKTLYYVIPKQVPSTGSEFLLSLTASVQKVSVVVIVATLLIQFVAKKVITAMWMYYCSLQIILFIVQQSNSFVPATVDIVITSVSGIVNLSSLDKEQIAKFLHLDALLKSSVVQSLDGVALSAIAIGTGLIVCGIAICITRRSPKIQKFLLKIKETIFWNFLIRYFQASFIGFNFSALTNLQKSGAGYQDICTSVLILAIQYGLVCYIFYILKKRDPLELNSQTVRKRIGNLYQHFDTRNRYSLMFGVMFFVQRSLIVFIQAIKFSYGIQWQLNQIVIMINTGYLLNKKPYLDPENSVLDKLNCYFLLIVCLFSSTFSFWNTELDQRVFYGSQFDSLVVLQFFVNLTYILWQFVLYQVKKLKRMLYQKKQKQAREKSLLKKQQQKSLESQSSIKKLKQSETDPSYFQSGVKINNTIEQDPQNLDLKSKSYQEDRKNQLVLDSEVQGDEYWRVKVPYNSNQEDRKNETELDSKDKGDEYWRVKVRSNSNQKNKNNQLVLDSEDQGDEYWRVKVLQDLDEISEVEEQVSFQDPQQHQFKQQVLKSLVEQDRKKTTISPNFRKNDDVKHTSKTTAQIQLAQLLSEAAVSSKLENQSKKVVEQTKSSQQDKQFVPNQQSQSLAKQSATTNTNLIQVKVKKPLLTLTSFQRVLQFQGTKEETASYNMASEQLTESQKRVLDQEIRDYFSIFNSDVRMYPREKVFTWNHDIWPYYRQLFQENKIGQTISQDMHKDQVRKHLMEQWIQTYPQQPYLPLQVSAETYIAICQDIEPLVAKIVERREQSQL